MFCRKTVKLKLSGGRFRPFQVERLVSIKHQNSQEYKKKLMLIDTGSDGNVIRRSIADELGLTIEPDQILVKGFNGYKVECQGHVTPDWYFLDEPKPKKRPGITFQVIERIPDDVDLLLGRISVSLVGIELFERSVCVAHQHLESSFCPSSSSAARLVTDTTASIDTVAQEQRKQQRIRQDRDTAERENLLRQEFAKRHAELIEEREADSNTSDHTQREISISQRDVGVSRDVRR